MADKASRALVIFGDGFMPLISHSHSHIHSLASQASCGFLSLRDSPPLAENVDETAVSELLQLLDAYGYVQKKSEGFTTDATLEFQEDLLVPSLSERFMGLRTAILTTCTSAKSLGRTLGFNSLQFDELIEDNHCRIDLGELPDAFTIASELLRLLGFFDGEITEQSEFDLVFVHIKALEKARDPSFNVANTEVEWLNAFVGEVMQIAQPGSKIASRLHLSLVMSYKVDSDYERDSSLTMISPTRTDSNLSLLFPNQSYTMKGGSLLNNIRHHHPMLVAQWQEAVTRRDMARAFSFKEFQEYGGNLAILADRFLHELAFKLWKAPKYGA
eukprot:TRINITY_DN1633_c2_g1_i1.p1 TRINITY_DN1633_c2_g1~~TRINITY_DN1633_c2_g1_i1.p1  ORF type:complete len:329 (-),score=54.15 TRINITY_DN1633_c2_g1_i1:523-1509(-)